MSEETQKYIDMPKVFINHSQYVDRDIYKEYLISKIRDEMKDASNQDERDGLEIAIQVIECH